MHPMDINLKLKRCNNIYYIARLTRSKFWPAEVINSSRRLKWSQRKTSEFIFISVRELDLSTQKLFSHLSQLNNNLGGFYFRYGNKGKAKIKSPFFWELSLKFDVLIIRRGGAVIFQDFATNMKDYIPRIFDQWFIFLALFF